MVATNALSKVLAAAKDIKTMLKHISLALKHSFKTSLIILKTNLRKNLSVGIAWYRQGIPLQCLI
jgi:hypothetical protein